MPYYVNMPETDFYGFAHSFSDADVNAIRNAVVGTQFLLSNGHGILLDGGDVILTFKSKGGYRHHPLSYAEIIRQFDQQDANDDSDDD